MDNIKADVVELTGDVLLQKQHSVTATGEAKSGLENIRTPDWLTRNHLSGEIKEGTMTKLS